MTQATATEVRTPRKRAAAAAGAVGLGAAILLGGAWIVRIPAADALLHSTLQERGVTGSWTLSDLSLTRAVLENVRIGAPEAPDFQARRVTLDFAWGLGPRIAGIGIEGGQVKARWTEKGLDLGDVGAFLEGPPATRRAPLPAISVRTAGFVATLATPLGAVRVNLDSSGVLNRDFRADATILDAAMKGEAGGVEGLRGALTVRTEAGETRARIEAGFAGLQSGAWRAEGASLAARATIDRAMEAGAASIQVRLSRAESGGVSLTDMSTRIEATAQAIGPGIRAESWTATLTNEIAALTVPGARATGAQAQVAFKGAGDAATGDWRLLAAGLDGGDLRARLEANGDLALRDGGLTGQGAARLLEGRAVDPRRMAARLDVLSATPAGPLAARAEPVLAKALEAFGAEAPLAFAWSKGAGAIRGAGPVSVRAQTGAALTLTPAADAPPWQVTIPEGRFTAAGSLALAGNGLPALQVNKLAIATGPETRIAGRLSIDDWRGEDARLDIDDLDLSWRASATDGALRIAGDVAFSGPLAGLRLTNAVAPLDLDGHLTPQGFALGPSRGCARVTAATIEPPSLVLRNAALDLCGDRNGRYVTRRPDGALGGGFTIRGATLAGQLADGGRAPVTVSFQGIDATLSGDDGAIRLDAIVDAPRYRQTFAADRAVTVAAARLDARVLTGGGSWRAEGTFADGVVEDPALPANVTDLTGGWRADPEGSDVVFSLENGAGRVTDKLAAPIFNPLRLSQMRARLVDGIVQADGAIALESTGAALGRFEARHDIAANAGVADIAAPDLRFSEQLQPFELSELARGVVENVDGPTPFTARAVWSGETLRVTGALTLDKVDAATAGLGPINDASGTIVFDDLTKLTTPPHQEIRLAQINPGVAVQDGVVKFQLLADSVVSLESAVFPFSRGRLSVAPTFVTIGAPETRYVVELQDVDVAQLIRDLDFKDLDATGRVEGVFPLIVTPRGARIEDGRLQAAAGGGTIAYTGQAGDAVTGGPGQIAFDALRSFRYDNLVLELNGDVDGEIVTGIRFQGVNNAPLTSATLVPGLRTIGATGLPFRFNVTVRAPFKALADRASRFSNPLKLIEDAQGPQGIDPSKVP